MKKITLLVALLIVSTAIRAQVFSDDFNTEVVDATTFANWNSIDEDGDGNFWEVFDADAQGYTWIMSGLGVDSDSWEGGTPFTPDNYLITAQPLDLTAVSGTTVSFIVGTYQTNGTFLDDKYSVYLTESNDPAIIVGETPILTRFVGDDVTASAGDGSDSAALITIDASAYDGQVVYLSFRHYDTEDQNSVLIDDVVVDGTLGTTDEIFQGFGYYVDADSQLQLKSNSNMEKIELYNVLGQQILTQKLNNTTETINLSGFTSGVYIATVTIEGQTRSFKIVKR